MISSKTTRKIITISESLTSQYRNKFSVFFAQKYAFENNITIEWVYTKSGHGKGPADGVGAAMKIVIDNVVSYNLSKPITNTTELINEWPPTDIVIKTYTQDEVRALKDSLLKKLKLKSAVGVASSHELICKSSGNMCLKKLPMDEVSFQVQISMETINQKTDWNDIDISVSNFEVLDNAESNGENGMAIDVNDWVISEFASTSNRISRYIGQAKSIAGDGSDYLEDQFYKAVNTKSSLKFKAFSSDTEVIESEQVIEMLNKPIMLNRGQIMLSKVPESHNIV